MRKRGAVKQRVRSAEGPRAAKMGHRAYIHDLPDELLLVVRHFVNSLADMRDVVHVMDLPPCFHCTQMALAAAVAKQHSACHA